MAVSVTSLAVQSPPPQAAGADALQLRSGQVLEARVLASEQGRQTRLSIGNTVLDAALQVKLQEGALIRLLVQGAAPNTRFTVLPQPSLQAQGQSVLTTAQNLPQAGGNSAAGSGAASQQAVQSRGASVPQAQTTAASSNAVTRSLPGQPNGNAGPAAAQSQANAGARPGPAPAQGAGAPGVLQTASATRNFIPASTGQAALSTHTAPLQTGGVQHGGPQQTLSPGTVLQLHKPGPNVRPVLVQGSSAGGNIAADQFSTRAGTPVSVNPGLQAVVQTAQGAIARQDSIAALLASLAGLGSKLSDLPRPVAQAGAGLLETQLRLDGKPLDGATLRQALQRSGVLFENTLAKGSPLPQGDIKSGLLKLAGALRKWLGDATAAKPHAENRPPPPLTPGNAPRTERPSSLPLPGDLAPRDAGARLLVQADAALSRMRLAQISSLPDSFVRGGQAAGPSPELNMELPLLLGGELSVGQFQVMRDGKNGAGEDPDGAWKMLFSINFSQTGEVGATVSLRRKKIGVMLWAEREDIAEALENMSEELETALEARGLETGAIRCRHGAPPRAKPPAGMFMDDCS